MGHEHWLLICLLIICTQFCPIVHSTSWRFYDECLNGTNVFCVGSRWDEGGIGEDCIEMRDCYSVLKVKKDPPSQYLSPSDRFLWELAVKYDPSKDSEHHYNILKLTVTKEKVAALTNGVFLPRDIPHWAFADVKNVTLNEFKALFRTCGRPLESPQCEKEIKGTQLDNYIRFGPMNPKEYADTKVQYLASQGISNHRLYYGENRYVEDPTSSETINTTLLDVDLFSDQVTIAIYHWHLSDLNNQTSKSHAGNFEPKALFCCKNVTLLPNGTIAIVQESKKGSLLWLWILLGILALLFILAIIYCCCCRGHESDHKPSKVKRTGSSASSVGSITPSRESSSKSSEKRKGIKKSGKKSNEKSGSKISRLDYIARLAGYKTDKTSGKVVKTKKEKSHNFDNSFHSDQTFHSDQSKGQKK